MQGPYFIQDHEVFFNGDARLANAGFRRPEKRRVCAIGDVLAVCYTLEDNVLLKHGSQNIVSSWLKRYRASLIGCGGEDFAQQIVLAEFECTSYSVAILNKVIESIDQTHNLIALVGFKSAPVDLVAR